MNKSLSVFMVVAAVALIVSTLIFGVAYKALEQKNDQHEKILQTDYQLKSK